MVQIQIDLPLDINQFVEVQMALNRLNDKRECILLLLKDRMNKEKELVKHFKKA